MTSPARLLMMAITGPRAPRGPRGARRGAEWMCGGKGQHEEAWGAAPHLADLLKFAEEDELFQYVKHSRLLGESCCHWEHRCLGSFPRLFLLLFPPFGNLNLSSLATPPPPSSRCRLRGAETRPLAMNLGGF